ncbi:MAG TPA: glycosyl hydrolase family 18 protein, partial [Gemmatimonadales bacterium]
MTPHGSRPTFHDPTGRRRRRLRIGAIVLGAITVVLALFVVSGIIIPPLLPDLPLRQTAGDSLGRIPRTTRTAGRHTISVRAERERLASRQRLFAELKLHPAPPSERLEQMRRKPVPGRADERLANRVPGDPIVAGFYVNWDDNSLISLKAHVDALDWIVGEWGLVRSRGRDSLPLQLDIKRGVLAYASHAANPPQILLMLTNATGDGFDPGAVRQLITRPRFRRRAIAEIVDSVRVDSLDGVTVDFEELPSDMHPLLLGFLRDLSRALKADHKILTQAVPGDDPSWPVKAYAKIDDRIFLMLYDEHDPSDDPGPIASQRWFEDNLRRVLRDVPARQIIVGVGQYGYQWSDTSDNAVELTFEDVMQLARDHTALPMMDRDALNPTFAWDDPDSTSNIVWYLDGPTAWNEIKFAQQLGVAGVGVWRLGAEDPSIWNVLGRDGLGASPAPMDTMRAEYDVNFIGSGEILRMVAEPTLGERRIVQDTATGFVVGERVTQTPSSYVIKRYGRRKKAVALTFDDGPDP